MQGWVIKEIPHKPVKTGTIARQRRDKRRILADLRRTVRAIGVALRSRAGEPA